MESQTNLSDVIFFVFFIAVVLHWFFQWRLEKNFLTDEERVKIKNVFPPPFGLLAMLLFIAFSIILNNVLGVGFIFGNLLKFLFLLVIFPSVFGYGFIKVSWMKLPAEFVGKWRKLELAFAAVLISFIVSNLVWNFIRWQTEGYKIFRSE